MRNRPMFLVSHSAGITSETYINFENGGVTPCLALSLGKTYRFYKLEYVPMIRNKHVEICPIDSLALWSFERIYVQDEPPLN